MHDKMKRADPVLIVFQIVALQCFYYAYLGLFYMTCHIVYGLSLSLDRFFDLSRPLDVFAQAGGLEVAAVITGALVG